MASKECPTCKARFRGGIVTCPLDGEVLVEPVDEYIGTTIAGRYLVEELIGRGGMARVYRARHQIIGRDVALKFLEPRLSKDARQRKRFLGEARAANQISHEHIIDITDYGETESGAVYMVMEYLDGRTVGDEIAEGPMEPRRALKIVEKVAQGLARAHELGVIHRDVKPDNICLIERGRERDYVKLLDFGIARIEQDMRITAAGTLIGTPEYIAPEQVRSSTATASTDMYSLGCVLYEMLTGQLPFEGGTSLLLVQHLNDPAPIPSDIEEDIPPEVDALVHKMMAKQPEHRHRDAYHLVEDLQRLIELLPSKKVPAEVPTRPDPPADTSGERRAVATEDDTWQRALAMFSALVREAHPRSDAPQWLSTSLRQMASLTEEVSHLRGRLLESGERATEEELDEAELRRQIGRALDQLGQDESKVSRAINDHEAQSQVEDAHMDEAMALIFKHAHSIPRPVRAGILGAEEARRISALVQATDALASGRSRVAKLRAKLDASQLERKDLVFQIAALKDKVTSRHTARTTDLDIVHEEVNRIDSQIHAKLEKGAALAQKVSEYFDQFPELRKRIARKTAGRPNAPGTYRGPGPHLTKPATG